MDINKLKAQFPFIDIKSENWYYNNLTKKWIHKDKISAVLAYYAVKDIDGDKKKFKQIDSFKSRRR